MTRQRRSFWMLAAALALLCALAAARTARAADHVIQISVDGLSGILLQALVENDAVGDFASFARFVNEGASTYNARADYTHTITLPNHTSMITGRPVSQPTGQPNTVHHGWTSNSDPGPGVTLHNGGNPNLSYVASVFDVAHDRGLSTGFYASKSKLVLFDQSYDAAHGAADVTGPNDGTDKIDRYLNASAASMHSAFLTEMAASHFDYVFIHYSTPDDVGHANGWGSAAWNDAVRTIDDDLADIFALIESDPLLDGHTVVILSADHGGTGTGHSTATAAANYTVPFLVWGDGVQPGADLYALNAGARADPGSGRPSYTAAVQPIRNSDGVNLALAALALPPVPGSSINAAQSLVPFTRGLCGNAALESGELCDDGNTTGGDCCGATCQYEAQASVCSDGNACTVSTCNGSGTCDAGPPVICSNGLYCDGAESCNPASGCVAGAPPSLDDGLVCTADSCDELLDQVVHAPNAGVCDDADACTADVCDAVLGCAHATIPQCAQQVPLLPPLGHCVLILLLSGAAPVARRRAGAAGQVTRPGL